MKAASEKSWQASHDYKRLFRDFMAKAANQSYSNRLEINAIMSFTFKRKLPETAKVIEGSRNYNINLKKMYSNFESISHINECD